LKVPTYQKYGITKSQLEKFDERNRKISNTLTHTLPFAGGIALGTTIYIINLSRFAPTNFFQVFYQLFLLISLSILSIGLLMVIFKYAEKYYYNRIENKNETYKSILSFKKDKEEFEYWHIRSDERFWKLIDGHTLEREVIGLYKKLGYELKSHLDADRKTSGYVLSKDGENILMSFITNKKVETVKEIEELVRNKPVYNNFIVVLSKGYKPDITEALDTNIKLVTTKDIIAMAKKVGD
jgi:hypothetical protein